MWNLFLRGDCEGKVADTKESRDVIKPSSYPWSSKTNFHHQKNIVVILQSSLSAGTKTHKFIFVLFLFPLFRFAEVEKWMKISYGMDVEHEISNNIKVEIWFSFSFSPSSKRHISILWKEIPFSTIKKVDIENNMWFKGTILGVGVIEKIL
jgi:hypothetical protein